MVYRLTVLFFGIIIKLFFSYKVEGLENIPDKGRVIFIANHQSYFDVFPIGVLIPRIIRPFAKKELYENFFLRLWLNKVRAIALDRDGIDFGAMKKAIECLEKEESVLVFPEGTRTKTGLMTEGRSGFLLLAHRTKTPFVPIAIEGTWSILPPGRKWPLIKPFSIKIGAQSFVNENVDFSDSVSVQGEVDRCVNKIAEMIGDVNYLLRIKEQRDALL